MLKIGCHLSASKGYENMADVSKQIGANTFQFFTRNPRGGSAKEIDEEDVKRFLEKSKEYGIDVILAHAPYTLNCASADESIRVFAKNTMKDDLKRIIDGTVLNEKLGVCLDTCHVNDAGYDIVNDLEGVLEEFDKIIGLDRLKAIHINDSKNPLGAHKDRHEKIGDGYLGVEFFERIINHPKLKDLPFFLETPNELDGYEKEIKMLKSLVK